MIAPEIKKLIKAFQTDSTPIEWIEHSHSHTRSIAIHVINFRNNFLWLQDSLEKLNSFSSQHLLLGAFRNPKGLLTAVRANFARRNNITLDMVVFDHSVLSAEGYESIYFQNKF